MNLTSRPATRSDLPFVKSVYFETQRWIIEELFGWRGDEIERAKFDEIYCESESEIVSLDGRDVGWMSVRRQDDGSLDLDALYLLPASQRKGIGTTLVRQVICRAVGASVPVTVSTAKINPARHLYERLGFVVTHESEFKVFMRYQPADKTVAGDNVTLRPASTHDLELLVTWFADPAFVRWWGGAPKSREEIAEKYVGSSERRSFIVEDTTGPIGYIQAWPDGEDGGGIDIVLVRQAQGRGLGVEAIAILARQLRNDGWNRIIVDPLAANDRAIAAFEKAGFTVEREYGEHVVLVFEPNKIPNTAGLRTERLEMRTPVAEDAQAIFDTYASDPRVTKYMDWPSSSRVSEIEDHLGTLLADVASGLCASWMIRKLDEPRLCGKIELRIHGDEGEVGYVLAASHWGQGIMPEALNAVLDFARRSGLRRVTGTCDPDNRASIRVFEKCGFSYVGRQKAALIRPSLSEKPRDSECYESLTSSPANVKDRYGG